jgi:hypothetical protein
MSEMIERVALAISGGDDPASILEIHRSRARTAMAAMRKPPEAMIDAGFKIDDFGESQGPQDVWDAMIDEALK